MGNVHAFSAAPTPPTPPPGMAPFNPNQDSKTDSNPEKIENPGPLEEIHQKCKST